MDRNRARGSEEPLLSIAARRVVRRVRAEAGTVEFGRLLSFQAAGAAGDALVAIALAGSLFFSVPETTARGKVALYLTLTVAPFAVLSPLLARLLDRHRGGLRWAMVISAVGRGLLAWLLATRLDSLLLFPLAFGILLMSKAALIVRGAVLPLLIPRGRGLVEAGASLSRATALAGLVAGLVGVGLVKLLGPRVDLLVATLVFLLATLPALKLPSPRGRRPFEERLGARAAARSMPVRQAGLMAAGMRLLTGFLVLHLAFSLRRESFSSLGLGLLVGSAAFGSLCGAIVAPRLRRTLREEGIIVTALVVAGAAALVAGYRFGTVAAGVLVFSFGVAAGALKVAFDAIVQRETPEGGRGWAFARFESVLQLAWVAGALLPLLFTLSSSLGTLIVGFGANVLALVYLMGRLRWRSGSIQVR